MAWDHYKIGRANEPESAISVYAPDLAMAFHLARLQEFGSADITNYGTIKQERDRTENFATPSRN